MNCCICADLPLLHPQKCNNSKADILRMRKILEVIPKALARYESQPGPHALPLQPIFSAIQADHDVCLEFLLKASANVPAVSDSLKNLMEYASISSSSISVFEVMLNCGINPNFPYSTGQGVTYNLHFAVQFRGNLNLVNLLLDNGAKVDDFQDFNIEIDKYFNFCPTINAIYYQHTDILKTLLLHGATVDHRQVGKHDLSPEVKDCLCLVHHCIFSARHNPPELKSVLNILYQFGANLWQRNRLGMTPLEVYCNQQVYREESEVRGIAHFADAVNVDDRRDVSDYMQELMGKPLSLRSLSRIALMRAMGPGYLSNLPKLGPLPRELLSFLHAEDLPE